MADGNSGVGLQLRSLVKASGELEVSLVQVPIPTPGCSGWPECSMLAKTLAILPGDW